MGGRGDQNECTKKDTCKCHEPDGKKERCKCDGECDENCDCECHNDCDCHDS